MTSAELLVDAFGRVNETVHEAVQGLTASQLAVRLDRDANSIAWLVWHLARVQDDHVADAFGVPQVWTEYGKRFELPFGPAEIGYGQSSEQVAQVTVSSGDLLTGYHDAVHEQTIRLVSGVTDADLSRVVDEAWDPPVTLSVRLVSVISDCLQHAGQAAFVRGILLRSGAEDRLSCCGQQVALITLAPAPRPGGRSGHGAPVVGKSLVAGGGRLGDDRVRPVVVGHDRLGHVPTVGAAQPAGEQEDPEPLQHATAAAVGDVLVVLQRHPGARGRGEVPGGAAGPGQVEVDQADGAAVAEHQVGRMYVVVADQAGSELGRDRAGPGVSRRVEGRRGEVVAAQQVGHAHQGGVGERIGRQRQDRGPAVYVGERLGAGADRQDARGAVEAGGRQVGEEGMGSAPAGRGRPEHGVADADHQAAVGGAAG